MTTDPAGRDPRAGEAAARRRHPSTHPWRTDHDGLAVRLAAYLEATGWAPAAARAEADEAKAAVRRG